MALSFNEGFYLSIHRDVAAAIERNKARAEIARAQAAEALRKAQEAAEEARIAQ